MNLKDIRKITTQLAEEKGISEKKILETIEDAFASAYRKDYGKKNQKIRAEFDLKTGELRFWQIKQVVTKDQILTEEEIEEKKEIPEGKIRFHPERHILKEEAQKINPDIKAGEDLEIPLETQKDYGRIAAQTAKQVILQKIREAEKEKVFEEFKEREGEIVSGIVQRVEKNNIYFDIGKILGILSKEEQIPGEFYRLGQRFKLYVLKVEKTPKGSLVFLSRAFPKFISQLFELEVPEISAEQVEIKAIAREAGSRTKIAVESKAEGIDAIGSVVGQRGTRVMAVINELGGEKIDIVEFNGDPEIFIKNALSPARALEVKLMPKNKALCLVPEDQLSLAIGKNGQNVRLAAKLTGWKIDVRPALTSVESSASAEAAAGKKKKTKEKEEKEKKKSNKKKARKQKEEKIEKPKEKKVKKRKRKEQKDKEEKPASSADAPGRRKKDENKD
jgi:N utilization substance protein A